HKSFTTRIYGVRGIMRSFSDFDLDGINTGIEKGPAKNDRSFFHRPFFDPRGRPFSLLSADTA
ncbi:MAG: hypothetical protein IJK86_09310, partial [Lachnospiraceae bacterium]|nr:hypothetical protein [Lachnospiraceae bacterium]